MKRLMKPNLIILISILFFGVAALPGCDSGENGQRAGPPAPPQPPAPSEKASGLSPPAPMGGSGARISISEEDLDRAATAHVALEKNHAELQKTLQEAQTPGERQRLQATSKLRMIRAIEDAGLDVETYNSIVQTVRTDELLKTKFDQKLERLE